MCEILHIQGGQCRNQRRVKFWEVVYAEYEIDLMGQCIKDADLQLVGSK